MIKLILSSVYGIVEWVESKFKVVMLYVKSITILMT